MRIWYLCHSLYCAFNVCTQYMFTIFINAMRSNTIHHTILQYDIHYYFNMVNILCRLYFHSYRFLIGAHLHWQQQTTTVMTTIKPEIKWRRKKGNKSTNENECQAPFPLVKLSFRERHSLATTFTHTLNNLTYKQKCLADTAKEFQFLRVKLHV